MFKVGAKRRPGKVLPGVCRLAILRAVSTQNELERPAGPYAYVAVKFKGHDVFRTGRKRMGKNKDGRYEIVFGQEKDERQTTEFDFPHIDWNSDISIELFGSPFADRAELARERAQANREKKNSGDLSDDEQEVVPHKDLDDDEEEADPDFENDVLLGAFKVPAEWVIDGFGGGYGVSTDDAVFVRLLMQGSRLRVFPFELEVKASYFTTPDSTQRATLRWTSRNFEGEFDLDRSRSDEDEAILQAMRTPFILRRLEEYGGDQHLSVRIGHGGSAIQLVRTAPFYVEDTGELRIDEMFQAVKTYRGSIIEKRLYWDFSSMGKMKPEEPYPAPILVMVGRISPSQPQIVEAWTLSKDFKVLTQLSMIGDNQDKRVKKVYVRHPTEEIERVVHPKVATRPGRLQIVVMNAQELTPVGNVPVNSFVDCKVMTFNNDDVHCSKPVDADAKSQVTPVVNNDPNPVWDQVLEFSVRPDNEFHAVAFLQVWNRESNEESLIGTVRIPVPWLFNGCGCDQGPLSVSSYEATFKLKRGDSLDPAEKVEYGGGRIRLRLQYVAN